MEEGKRCVGSVKEEGKEGKWCVMEEGKGCVMEEGRGM